MALRFVGWQTWGPFAIPHFISFIKYKHKTTSEVEMIGVKDPDLFLKTVSGTALTETTFDTTTRPDEARILFTNASGVAQVVTACWIRGKAVKKVGGDSGYINDKHVNYEAIARDGESKFELGNDYICTLTQVNKLADFYWKYNKTKKHIYTVSLPGIQAWFEPGEWYGLTIGSAGTAEYVDSTVECYSVRTSYSATGTMGTQVSFREVEENWKFDSNETARYVAAGGHTRAPQGTMVTVAPVNYPGYADYYCDGTTGDPSVIDAAIANSSGHVRLLVGDYNICSMLHMTNKSSFTLDGEGMGSRLVLPSSGFAILDISGAISSTSILVDNLSFVGSTSHSDTEAHILLYIDRVDNVAIQRCGFSHFRNTAIELAASNNISASFNSIDGSGCGSLGIYNGGGSYCSFVGNKISDLRSTGETVGIDDNGYKSIITNNLIEDIAQGTSTLSAIGIRLNGDDFNCNSNLVQNVNSTYGTTSVYGLFVSGSNNMVGGNKIMDGDKYGIYISTGASKAMVTNNYCINNGGDTGIGTTANNNFYDQGTDTVVG